MLTAFSHCAFDTKTLESVGRGVAQPGSASALGAEGRWFESSLPDQFIDLSIQALNWVRFSRLNRNSRRPDLSSVRNLEAVAELAFADGPVSRILAGR
jgi:hypothetical protein